MSHVKATRTGSGRLPAEPRSRPMEPALQPTVLGDVAQGIWRSDRGSGGEDCFGAVEEVNSAKFSKRPQSVRLILGSMATMIGETNA